MRDTVLTINAGSSTVKFALFAGESAILRGAAEGIGTQPAFSARTADGTALEPPGELPPSIEAIAAALPDWVAQRVADCRIVAAGHRVVHGGPVHEAPERVTPALLKLLEEIVPLAPLHLPASLAPMRAIAAQHPELPQVACFDTSFHRTMPEIATRVALPPSFAIRRYGFHGLSYENVVTRLRADAPHLVAGRVLAAHLGSGATLCALRNGESIEVTTGLTALDGLMMATRCGSLDPGAVLYLLDQDGMTADQVTDLLYHKSGLLGVSGLSGDMRRLLASDTPAARAAVDLFVYRAVREAGSLIAVLGGLDGIVFTGGIGEHTPVVRAAICAGLAWLGITLDPAANARADARISAPASRVEVRIIPADEEIVIARQTRHVLEIPG